MSHKQLTHVIYVNVAWLFYPQKNCFNKGRYLYDATP